MELVPVPRGLGFELLFVRVVVLVPKRDISMKGLWNAKGSGF